MTDSIESSQTGLWRAMFRSVLSSEQSMIGAALMESLTSGTTSMSVAVIRVCLAAGSLSLSMSFRCLESPKQLPFVSADRYVAPGLAPCLRYGTESVVIYLRIYISA